MGTGPEGSGVERPRAAECEPGLSLKSGFRPLLSAVIISVHHYLWSTDCVPGMWGNLRSLHNNDLLSKKKNIYLFDCIGT